MGRGILKSLPPLKVKSPSVWHDTCLYYTEAKKSKKMYKKELADTLHSLLAHNIVSFIYQKVNGEIRHAFGTRNLDLAGNYTGTTIPTPNGAEQPNSYYDVEKMGWRSYKPENLISIDGVIARTDTDFAKKPTLPNEPPKETKKPELPKREIPVSKPMGNGGVDIDKFLGGIFGGFGLARPSKEEIRKSMDDLDKDITIGNPTGKRFNDGKIHTPVGGVPVPVDDFARLVAKYVVDEFVSRIKG